MANIYNFDLDDCPRENPTTVALVLKRRDINRARILDITMNSMIMQNMTVKKWTMEAENDRHFFPFTNKIY